MSEVEPVGAVEGRAPVERRLVTVLEAHTLADCADPAACWWPPHRAGAIAADQSQPSAPRDGLAGSDEAVVLAPNRVRPSQVIIVGARMTEDVLGLVRVVEEGFAEAVRAQAVVEERQRIAQLIRQHAGPENADGICVGVKRWPTARAQGYTAAVNEIIDEVLGDAAGSVPVATPTPMGDATLLAKHAAYISRTVTASYPAGMDPELVMRRRVGKIFVEAGELGDAIEGWTGENPRKGIYATREDVIKELIDCASASLCAIEYMTGDAGLSVGMVARQVTGNAQRLSESIPDACEPDAGPVATPVYGEARDGIVVTGFQPEGPSSYRAASMPDAPLRATRAEAEADQETWLDRAERGGQR